MSELDPKALLLIYIEEIAKEKRCTEVQKDIIRALVENALIGDLPSNSELKERFKAIGSGSE